MYSGHFAVCCASSFALWSRLFTIETFVSLAGSSVHLGKKIPLKPFLENPGGPGHDDPVYWRVEGSLLELTTVRSIAFFTWNLQTFSERWTRRGLVFLMAVLRPILYATNREFATRVVHSVLRRVSRDRLDLLGEEYFQYKLKPQLKPEGVRHLQTLVDSGKNVVLVSQGLDHV